MRHTQQPTASHAERLHEEQAEVLTVFDAVCSALLLQRMRSARVSSVTPESATAPAASPAFAMAQSFPGQQSQMQQQLQPVAFANHQIAPAHVHSPVMAQQLLPSAPSAYAAAADVSHTTALVGPRMSP